MKRVDYNTAVALKEAGYDVPCDAFMRLYANKSYSGTLINQPVDNHNLYPDAVSAPYLHSVCDWLRDKGLHVIVGKQEVGWFYLVDELAIAREVVDLAGRERYDTHDTALSAAITHALTLLP